MEKVYSLITGSTSGIGKEFTNILAENNHNLVLISKDIKKLEIQKEELTKKYKIDILIFDVDLSNYANQITFLNTFIKLNLKVDLVCNNAGIGDYGNYLESDLKKVSDIINVNIQAVLNFSYFFGRLMKESKNGTIINVASIGAFVPGYLMNVYYATKAFVKSFSESLYLELKPYNVKVICVCPGSTNTSFFNGCARDGKNLTKNIKQASPINVAKKMYQALNTKNPVVIIGVKNKLAIFSKRFISDKCMRHIMYKIQKNRLK